jgi:hypothetical protein
MKVFPEVFVIFVFPLLFLLKFFLRVSDDVRMETAGSVCCQPFQREKRILRQLPAASSVEPSASMEATAATRRREAMESATSTDRCAAAESSIMPFPTVAIKAWPATVEPRPAIEPATAVVTVEPRTGAHEHAPGKVVRAVIAIRCACIWGIAVVSIGTNGSRTNVGWSITDPYSDPDLRVGCPRHNHAKPKQNRIL